MSTKTRMIFQWGGRYYSGGQVKKQMSNIFQKYGFMKPSTVGLTSKNKLIAWYKELRDHSRDASLWVFQEQKLLGRGRSRYKILCKYVGAGKVVKKKGSRNYEEYAAQAARAVDALVGQEREAVGDVPRPRGTAVRYQVAAPRVFRIPRQAPIAAPNIHNGIPGGGVPAPRENPYVLYNANLGGRAWEIGIAQNAAQAPVPPAPEQLRQERYEAEPWRDGEDDF